MVRPPIVIWVATPDKEVVGYLSIGDFCAMTGCTVPVNGQGLRNGVELHRTAEYIFGALRTTKQSPTLQWSNEQQRLEPIHLTAS
jgi:hypothetical protein